MRTELRLLVAGAVLAGVLGCHTLLGSNQGVEMAHADQADSEQAERGWHDEPMPEGMRRAEEKDVYIWDTGKGLEIEMVYVPPGEFVMGNDSGLPVERPEHTHPMPEGYYIGRYPTTVGHFRRFVEDTGYRTTAERDGDARTLVDGEWQPVDGASWRYPGFRQSDDHPVVCVSWEDAKAFCDWAGLALPSEAHWEKAARGTDGRRYPWGNADPTRAVCWNRDTRTRRGTDSVTNRPRGASPYGALDMAGNVREWTADRWDNDVYERYARGDTAPPSRGRYRVFRGGSWVGAAGIVHTTPRSRNKPGARSPICGFRPARVITD